MHIFTNYPKKHKLLDVQDRGKLGTVLRQAVLQKLLLCLKARDFVAYRRTGFRHRRAMSGFPHSLGSAFVLLLSKESWSLEPGVRDTETTVLDSKVTTNQNLNRAYDLVRKCSLFLI